MGLYHCLSSSCATVHYREYLPPVVRWRYPGEDWQEIGGDDFNLEENDRGFEGGQCCDLSYRIIAPLQFVDYARPNQVRFTVRYERETRPNGKVIAFEPDDNLKRENGISTSWIIYYKDCNGFVRTHPLSTNSNSAGWLDSTAHIESITVVGEGEDNCDVDECVFTITNQGVEIYRETREDCPEVEKLPCRLSEEYKQIKIDKTPFIDVVRVIDYAFAPFGLNVIRGNIPDECLNIYNDSSTQIVPLPGGVPTPNNGDISQDNSFGFITQICSAPGCPPPEYTVVCDCQDECPPGTCGVRCGSSICCYGSDGKSQAELPLSNFFPTNTSGGNSR